MKHVVEVERVRAEWAEMEAAVPKFADVLPRSADDVFKQCDAMLQFALALNPALADGDGDLEEHLRVHERIMGQQAVDGGG